MTRVQFSLRSLMALTTFIAISITALWTPSVWCAVALHGFLTILVVFSAIRATLSNGRRRAFWATFLGGILVYLGVVFLLNTRYDARTAGTFPYQIDVLHAYLGKPLWSTIHGEDRDAFFIHDSSDIPGWSSFDVGRDRFLSFLLSLHILIAVAVSAMLAIAVQFIFARLASSGQFGSPSHARRRVLPRWR